MRKSVVIGLSGGSGSGKSTVLSKIIEAFGYDRIAVLDHDAYYQDLSHLEAAERAALNFDHPDALDTQLMSEHLDNLIEGDEIKKPVYDYTNHTRTSETVVIQPRPVIILEGILVLAEKQLRERMDIKLFVDAADDVRLIRRIRRDMVERKRDINSILDQYARTVRPMHLEFVEPSKRFADIIIPRGGHNKVAIEMVIARIDELVSRSTADP